MKHEVKLAEVLSIGEDGMIRPRTPWREAFESMGETRSKGFSYLDYINECARRGVKPNAIEWAWISWFANDEGPGAA